LLPGVEYQAAAADVIALTSAAWGSVQQQCSNQNAFCRPLPTVTALASWGA
jgi:hypothetical protein